MRKSASRISRWPGTFTRDCGKATSSQFLANEVFHTLVQPTVPTMPLRSLAALGIDADTQTFSPRYLSPPIAVYEHQDEVTLSSGYRSRRRRTGMWVKSRRCRRQSASDDPSIKAASLLSARSCRAAMRPISDIRRQARFSQKLPLRMAILTINPYSRLRPCSIDTFINTCA
jgi:hypothetical protein